MTQEFGLLIGIYVTLGCLVIAILAASYDTWTNKVTPAKKIKQLEEDISFLAARIDDTENRIDNASTHYASRLQSLMEQIDQLRIR